MKTLMTGKRIITVKETGEIRDQIKQRLEMVGRAQSIGCEGNATKKEEVEECFSEEKEMLEYVAKRTWLDEKIPSREMVESARLEAKGESFKSS